MSKINYKVSNILYTKTEIILSTCKFIFDRKTSK